MSIYEALGELARTGGSGVLCSIVRSQGSTPRHVGSKMLVYPDGQIVGTVGGGELESLVVQAALQALEEGQPRLLPYEMVDPKRGDPGVCGGRLEIFVDPILASPVLVVVGGGHVGRAVVHLAGWLDFRVVLSDDRLEFCTPEAVPGADSYIHGPLEALGSALKITPSTYLVLCTRNVEVDVKGLPPLLESPAAYIGVIGSKRRWSTARKILSDSGIPDEQLDRVTSPMGLEIHAETPEQIAVSILAEILMLRLGGDGRRMGS